MAKNSTEEEDPSVVLDRFVSASNAQDVRVSLQGLLESLQQQSRSASNNSSTSNAIAVALIEAEPQALEALLEVLQTSEYKRMSVEDGSSLAARICLHLIENSSPSLLKRLLQEPAPGRFLQALLDVASNNSHRGEGGGSSADTFTRVMALQCLRHLASSSGAAHTVTQQLLDSPNGLHRLGSELLLDKDEQVRNEALLLATSLSEWPAVARNWMFQDVGVVVMQLALTVHDGDGLTHGHVLVHDCLQLLVNLIKHDAAFADLVLESRDILPALTQLLDLRQGAEFKYPKARNEVKRTTLAQAIDEDEEEDDLDNLLKTGSSSAAVTKDKTKPKEAEEQQQQETVVMPKLTKSEEDLIMTVFDILAIVMERDDIRRSVWKRHAGLTGLVWEMALLLPPPPGSGQKFPCAMPSTALQQRALQMTAMYFADHATLQRLNGLDRLLYIVCTGGGAASSATQDDNKDKSLLDDCLALSQSALHVIRQALPPELAQEMLAHSLVAPPPPIDDDEQDASNANQQQPTVVQKLLNTIMENLEPPPPSDDSGSATMNSNINNNSLRRKVLLLGATSALTLFLTDAASRSVLLKLAGGPDFCDRILQALILDDDSSTGRDDDATRTSWFVQTVLLRFLTHWMVDAPEVSQALLSSTQSSLVLSQLLFTTTATTTTTKLKSLSSPSSNQVQALTCLFLGLVLVQMSDDNDNGKNTNSKLFGGWTESGIMEMVNGGGGGGGTGAMDVSKFTVLLESLKNDSTLPWSACRYEFQIWSTWAEEAVFTVRKRLVRHLVRGAAATASSSEQRDDDDKGVDDNNNSQETTTELPLLSSDEIRMLQRFVALQSEELEELQNSLSKANTTIATQEKAVSVWKRRAESTPTKLDEMLNEYTSKNANLEKEIRDLQEKMRVKDETHSSELKQRDEQIASLESSLQEARDQDEEARQERDSLREELTALSQAYTHLEDDYRQTQQQQQQQQPAVLSTGEQAGESAQEQQQQNSQQPQGEGSGQAQGETTHAAAVVTAAPGAGSTEVATLRADNARLRQDARAADEWMAMAVERMSALNGQNIGLQQEVATLQAQLVAASSTSSSVENQGATLQRMFAEEQTLRLELENKLVALEDSTEQILAQERARGQALETELQRANTELVQQLEVERAQYRDVAVQLERCHADIQSMNSVRQELERSVEATKGELESSRPKNAAMRRGSGVGASTISEVHGEASAASLEPLQTELENARAELEKTKTREQEEIYRREARIRELEARLDGGLGRYTIEDIRKRDEDIEQLQKANEDAQEWMAKAVEHHQLLSNQVANLTQEKGALAAEARDLSSKVNATIKFQQLESTLLQRTQELDDNRSEIALRDDRIEKLSSELQQIMSVKDSELQQLTEANQRLMEQTAQVDSILAERDSLVHERDALQLQVQQLDSTIEGLTQASQQVAGTEKLSTQGDVERIAELEAEVHNLSMQLANVENEANAAIAGWKERYDAVEANRQEMESQLQTLRSSSTVEGAGTRSEGQLAGIVELESKVDSLQMQLADQERDASSVISQWQESYAALESNRNELESDLEVLRREKATDTRGDELSRVVELEARITSLDQQLVDQKDEAAGIIAQWQESYNSLEANRNDVAAQLYSLQQENASDLGGQVRVLEEQLVIAEKMISEWKENYETMMEASRITMEKRVQELEQEKEEILAANQTRSDDEGSEMSVRLLEFEVKVKALEEQLIDQEKQANDVIVQWQERVQALELELEHCREPVAEKLDEKSMSVSDLETKVETLEKRLADQEEQTNAVISQWQERYESVFASQKETETELEQLKGGKPDTAAALTAGNGEESEEQSARLSELEAKVAYLEEQLEDQSTQANEVIAQWQDSYTALELNKKEVESQLEELKSAKNGIVGEQAPLSAQETEAADLSSPDQSVVVAEFEAKVKALEEQLVDQGKQANDVILQWEERVQQLESELEVSHLPEADAAQRLFEEAADSPVSELATKVEVLEKQLVDQEAQANAAISQWQDRYESLLANHDKNESELEQLKRSMPAAAALPTAEDGDEAAEQAILNTEPELEAKVVSLEEQLVDRSAQTNEVIAMWQESYTALESDKKNVESEIATKVEALEKQLIDQEMQANAAISQWQERYESVLASEKEPGSELELPKISDPDAAAGTAAKDGEESEEQAVRISELEAKVTYLEEQLEDQSTQANEVIAQWQDSYTVLELNKKEIESELEELTREKAGIAGEPAPLREKEAADPQFDQSVVVAELEAKVKALEGELEFQETQANEVIAQWEERVQLLETELDMSHLTKSDTPLGTDKSAPMSEHAEALEKQLVDQETLANAVISQWQERYESLVSELEQLKGGNPDSVAAPRDESTPIDKDGEDAEEQAIRVAELEARVVSLEERLADQSTQANEVIAQWQGSYTALESFKNEVETELEELKKQRAGIGELSAAVQEGNPFDRPDENSVRVLELEASLRSLEGQLVDQEQQATKVVAQWEESYAALSASKDELQSETESLEKKLGELETHSQKPELELAEHAEKNKEHEEQIRDLQSRINQSDEVLTQTRRRCKQLEDELSFLVDQAESYEGTIADRDVEISDLQRRLEDSQESETSSDQARIHLEHTEVELKRIQERLSSLTAENNDLSEALKNSEISLNAARERVETLEIEAEAKSSLATSFEAKISEIEKQSEQDRMEAEDAISEWESSYQDLERRALDLEGEVNALKDERDSLKVMLKVAESKLDSEKTANDALTMKHEESEARLVHAGEQLVSERDSFLEELGSLRSQVKMLEKDRVVAEEEAASLQKELDDLANESEEIINQWKERVDSLESLVRDLEVDIDAQAGEAKEAIASWELRCLELEETIENLASTTKDSTDDASTAAMIEMLEAELVLKRKWVASLPGQNNNTQEEEAVEDRSAGEGLFSLVLRLRTNLAEHNSRLEEAFENLDQEKSSIGNDESSVKELRKQVENLACDKVFLEMERHELQALVRDLEDELREASDAMQLHITNEVSEKATEIAAEALRQQVDEMRSRTDIDRHAFLEEHKSRKAAEGEVEHLRADLAALLRLADTVEMRSEISYRAIQAREDFQRKERSEIEDLKEALARALDELASARSAAATAEENASKAILQATMYEQEFVATKADLKVLTEKMDEMREAESTKREAMEYRISTLQNDHDVLRRQHAAQMEKLQNEFNHISMERDRLFQSLKDSERNKEALLRASSGRDAMSGEEDPLAELTKLRLEKAQLLVAASEEGTRVERRLREARAVEQSSAETDNIVERELRLAAEKALENVKLEMAELRMEVQGGALGDTPTPAMERSHVSELISELDSLKMEIETISTENSSLRRQLETAKHEAGEQLGRLADECRRAKTRASQLEREGRLEAEVQAEVSRLRAQANGTDRSYRMPHDNPAEEDRGGEEIPVAHLYDVIQKQKQSIDEDHAVYSKLLSEHDDLLALLAQHDIIRSNLMAALVRAAGQTAVEEALREAEEEATTQYGSFIHLT